MPELLKGTALKWYIANNEHWRRFLDIVQTSFQEFFLPRDLFTKLLEEVTRRKQASTNLQEIYGGDANNGSLIELLMQLAEEFEELERDRERLRQHTRPNWSRLMAIEDFQTTRTTLHALDADHASTQPQPNTGRAHSRDPQLTCQPNTGVQEMWA
ncbi:hypothetical protein ACLKA6_017492 [Drosophila palustris]